MSDAERATVVERVGAVVTCEGRALNRNVIADATRRQ